MTRSDKQKKMHFRVDQPPATIKLMAVAIAWISTPENNHQDSFLINPINIL